MKIEELRQKYRENMSRGDDLYEEILERNKGNKADASPQLCEALSMAIIRRGESELGALHYMKLMIGILQLNILAFFAQDKS